MDTTTYDQHRTEMQTGDCLAFRGTGLIDRGIQWRTRSRINHVSLILRMDEGGVERLFMVHANLKYGVQLLPVSRYLSQFKGQAWWVQLDHLAAGTTNPNYRPDMIRSVMYDLGRSYDLKGVLKFLLPWVRPSEAAYFCSELTATKLRDVGLTQDTWVSPEQFVRQPIFTRLVSLA